MCIPGRITPQTNCLVIRPGIHVDRACLQQQNGIMTEIIAIYPVESESAFLSHGKNVTNLKQNFVQLFHLHFIHFYVIMNGVAMVRK